MKNPYRKVDVWTGLEDSKSALLEELQLIIKNMPRDPNQFYQDLGLLQHPDTGKPVPRLTAYQTKVWKDGFYYKYRLTIKSQKVGISTSSLMEDFQIALTRARGKEILLIAQSLNHAKEHLYTLRKIIISSPKYSKFLISEPTELLLKDEVTKVMMLYIQNPDNLNRPTRIIGLGPKEGGVWSWKEVEHIHMSDITAASIKDDTGLFGAAFSRLANTNGSMHIETPPRGQLKSVWSIYQASELKNADEAHEQAKFKINKIPVTMAIQAGLITEEFIEAERIRLGPQFAEKYECEFLNPSNTWYDDSLIHYDAGQQLSS